MKSGNKNKFGKSSIQSMIRIAQISEYGFNEIFPKILMRQAENIKKIKKKKQNNKKQANTKQNNIKIKKGIQKK
jgi:hypothetical protein